MKKIIIISVMVLISINFSLAQKYGHHNVLIGEKAGNSLTCESYCVIVGHDSLAINAKGEDMIWCVDWTEPYLLKNLDVKQIIEHYYKEIILTKKDDKDYRVGLILELENRNNRAFGYQSGRLINV